MAHSYLIVGGNSQTRLQKALQIMAVNLGKKIPNFLQNPDVMVLQEKDSLKIEQIRNLKKRLQLKPFALKSKIALILDAEKLTIAAQNALLKTLEEPPERTLIILTSSNSEVLLPTIVSRCQLILLPSQSEFSYSPEEIKRSLDLCRKILTMRLGERLRLTEKIAETREKANQFTIDQTYLWRRLLKRKLASTKKSIPLNKLKLFQIIKTIRNIQKTQKMINNQVNYRLAVENLLISYPYLA